MKRRGLVPMGIVFLLLLAPSGSLASHVTTVGTETLVEGHTTFTLLTTGASRVTPFDFPTTGVQEGGADRAPTSSRFPGVLWFNHQFLIESRPGYVAPEVGTTIQSQFASAVAVLAREAGAGSRLPCGGAVIAWDAGGSLPVVSDPSVSTGGMAQPWKYRDSLLVTDPNDHTWMIDRYSYYGGIYSVVNIGGSTEFQPDLGDDCDLGRDVTTGYAEARADAGVSALPGGAPCMLAARQTCGAYVDDPRAGYLQPSSTGAWAVGYCYNGQPYETTGAYRAACDEDPDHDWAPNTCDGPCAPRGLAAWTGCETRRLPANPSPCPRTMTAAPVRLYNALLVFDWADLTVARSPQDHFYASQNPYDTNGCEVGTEWACPADYDRAEGNSHSFRPTQNLQLPRACPSELADPHWNSQVNHGGSPLSISTCLPFHAARQVDLLFLATKRPAAPLMRTLMVLDTQGSSSLFGDPDPN